MSIFRGFTTRFGIYGDGTEIFIKCIKTIPFKDMTEIIGQDTFVFAINNSNGLIARYKDKQQAAEALDRLKNDSNLIVRFAFKHKK
jgi:hypothetical protein